LKPDELKNIREGKPTGDAKRDSLAASRASSRRQLRKIVIKSARPAIQIIGRREPHLLRRCGCDASDQQQAAANRQKTLMKSLKLQRTTASNPLL
jgi:hypothetical protein